MRGSPTPEFGSASRTISPIRVRDRCPTWPPPCRSRVFESGPARLDRER